MAKPVKKVLPWHVISTGFGADDFISIGRGDAYLPPDKHDANVAWFKTRDDAIKHPAADKHFKKQGVSEALINIDKKYKSLGIDKVQSHTAKATMAALYLGGLVNETDDDLTLLTGEAAARGITPTEMAEIWRDKARELYPLEVARMTEKLQAENPINE